MAGSARPDGAARRLALVATEIIEDDDVARLQRWGQSLIDIGPEALAVDWTIENPWASIRSHRKAARKVIVFQ